MHGEYTRTHDTHIQTYMQNHLQTKSTVQTNNIFAAQALDKEK